MRQISIFAGVILLTAGAFAADTQLLNLLILDVVTFMPAMT